MSIETLIDEHRVGGLVVPDNIDVLPVLSARKEVFVAPRMVDLRDYCTKTQDQGNKPWCAAYAAVGFASNVLWRKDDYPRYFDPEPIYRYAKSIDGIPKTDGTTLVAALQGVLHENIFDAGMCSIKVLRTIEQVKYAIHKFGCCLLGVMVSKEWYLCNSRKATISGKKNRELLGGHAVLACGFTPDGIIFQNTWGIPWGQYGFALITWGELEREFAYGAIPDNCLYNTKMN